MSGVNITSLHRDGEMYVVIYEDGQENDAARAIGKWAGDPQLKFNWLNAACMCKEIRKQGDGDDGGAKRIELG